MSLVHCVSTDKSSAGFGLLFGDPSDLSSCCLLDGALADHPAVSNIVASLGGVSEGLEPSDALCRKRMVTSGLIGWLFDHEPQSLDPLWSLVSEPYDGGLSREQIDFIQATAVHRMRATGEVPSLSFEVDASSDYFQRKQEVLQELKAVGGGSWLLSRVNYHPGGSGECSLGHKNLKYEFIVREEHTGTQISFGSTCVSDFFAVDAGVSKALASFGRRYVVSMLELAFQIAGQNGLMDVLDRIFLAVRPTPVVVSALDKSFASWDTLVEQEQGQVVLALARAFHERDLPVPVSLLSRLSPSPLSQDTNLSCFGYEFTKFLSTVAESGSDVTFRGKPLVFGGVSLPLPSEGLAVDCLDAMRTASLPVVSDFIQAVIDLGPFVGHGGWRVRGADGQLRRASQVSYEVKPFPVIMGIVSRLGHLPHREELYDAMVGADLGRPGITFACVDGSIEPVSTVVSDFADRFLVESGGMDVFPTEVVWNALCHLGLSVACTRVRPEVSKTDIIDFCQEYGLSGLVHDDVVLPSRLASQLLRLVPSGSFAHKVLSSPKSISQHVSVESSDDLVSLTPKQFIPVLRELFGLQASGTAFQPFISRFLGAVSEGRLPALAVSNASDVSSSSSKTQGASTVAGLSTDDWGILDTLVHSVGYTQLARQFTRDVLAGRMRRLTDKQLAVVRRAAGKALGKNPLPEEASSALSTFLSER